MALGMALLVLQPGPALADESVPTITLSGVDLARYPQASLTAQISGMVADEGSFPAEAFEVRVDGIPVADLAVSGTEGRPLPSSTVLLLDESGSMEGTAITEAVAAARGYIQTLRSGDLLAVYSFSAGWRSLQDLTGDQAALSASLDGISLQRETNLYDSVARSLEILAAQPSDRGRYLVVLSDGGDTNSELTLEEVTAKARESGVQVYAVGLKTRDFNSTPMQQIAEASGGRYLETPDPGTLSSLYVSLARELQSKYLLSFTLAPPAEGWSLGDIAVTVTNGTRTATARAGFVYPVATTTTTLANLSLEPRVGRLSSFVAWNGSRYVLPIIIAGLIFVGLFLLSGVLAPKRNVLREYRDVLDNRRRLEPTPTGDTKPKRPAERLVAWFLALRGYEDPIQRRIEDAGWRLRTSEFVLAHLLLVIACAAVPQVLGASLPLTIAAVVLAVLVPLALLDLKARSRRKAFEAQVPDTLTIIASSLRAGQGFEQALQVVADESSDPTAHEFKRLLAQQRLGVSPEETLTVLSRRMQSEAFEWVVMVTIIQRQVGGNLAETYEKIAETLRERVKLQRETQILTAEARLSAVILALLPFVVFAAGYVVNRPYMELLFATKAGAIMVALALLGMVVGVVWLSRLAKVEA